MKVDNRKIQIRLAPFIADYKIVEYRIDESELNWFSRIFNKWHSLKYYHNPTNIDLTFLDIFTLQCYWEPYIVKKNTISEVKEQFKTMIDYKIKPTYSPFTGCEYSIKEILNLVKK